MTAADRPIWILLPGGRPVPLLPWRGVRAATASQQLEATRWTRAGDREWRPIGTAPWRKAKGGTHAGADAQGR